MNKIIRLLPIGCLLLCGWVNASEKTAAQNAGFCAAVISSSTGGGAAGVKRLVDNAAAASYLRINHPCEGAHMGELSSSFVYGQANASGTLTINGKVVPIDPGGGFLAMVNLAPGECKINAELKLGDSVYAVTHNVFVDSPSAPSPVSPLTIEYVTPGTELMVMAGDEISVTAKGSPGMKASFTLGVMKKNFPMIEGSGGHGIYRGVYIANAQENLTKTKIIVTLTNTKNHRTKSKTTDGFVSLLSDTQPLVAQTTTYATLYSGPELSKKDTAGYSIFLPTGTYLRVTGAKGDEFRVRLTKTKEAWISKGSVKMLPAGTPTAHAIAETITIKGGPRSTEIYVPLGRRIPFEVVPDMGGKYIDVSFYGAYSNTDFMYYISTGVVEQVKWFQDDAETYRVRAFTPSAKWWGYDARYEGKNFVLEVRNPPPAVAGSTLPLAGLTIAVDAGHTPDTGAIGVTGLLERDVNLEIAKELKNKLVALGANVFMTRPGTETVQLIDRPKLAWQARADIFVSVHNNSLNDAEDPFKKNGYEIYYYHPQSFALASEIHAAYGEVVGAASPLKYNLHDGGICYGNFVITRTTEMPAVLTESAYMIVPREEALLKTEQFRASCAEAIARGITRYMSRIRPAPEPRAFKLKK